jgi:hypothetical protein
MGDAYYTGKVSRTSKTDRRKRRGEMLAQVQVMCKGCLHFIALIRYDTSEFAPLMGREIQQAILDHRPDCPEYRDPDPLPV